MRLAHPLQGEPVGYSHPSLNLYRKEVVIMTKYTAEQIATARERLAFLRPGDVIQTQLLNVSRSGMSREIAVYIARLDDDGQPYIADLSWPVAVLTGQRLNDRGGVIVGGVGMDMGFHLIYSLGRALYPEGVPCTGSTGWTKSGRRSKLNACRSNDHDNGDRTYSKSNTHRDSGYAFYQEWL